MSGSPSSGLVDGIGATPPGGPDGDDPEGPVFNFDEELAADDVAGSASVDGRDADDGEDGGGGNGDDASADSGDGSGDAMGRGFRHRDDSFDRGLDVDDVGGSDDPLMSVDLPVARSVPMAMGIRVVRADTEASDTPRAEFSGMAEDGADDNNGFLEDNVAHAGGFVAPHTLATSTFATEGLMFSNTPPRRNDEGGGTGGGGYGLGRSLM